MANTITIEKLPNGNVLIKRNDEFYSLNPDSQCFKKDNFVELRDKKSSLIDTFRVVDVEKVIQDDGTEVLITDIDTLFSQLITFFFFKLAANPDVKNLKHLGSFTNYTDLITQHPTAGVGNLAYVLNSQGTSWLPGSMLGTFYSKGTYAWNGTDWSSSVDDIAKAIEDLNTSYSFIEGTLSRVGETTIPLMNQQNGVFENYIKLSFTPKKTVNHIINVSALWSMNSTNDSFIVNLVIDDGITLITIPFVTESKDSSGNGEIVNVLQGGSIIGNANTSTDQKIPLSFSFNKELIIGANYEVRLDFASDRQNAEATIYQAQISVEQKQLRI